MTNRYQNINSSQTVGLPSISPMSPGRINPINTHVLANGDRNVDSQNTPAFFTFENEGKAKKSPKKKRLPSIKMATLGDESEET